MTDKPSTRLSLKRRKPCQEENFSDDDHASKKTKVEVVITSSKQSGSVTAGKIQERKRVKASRPDQESGGHYVKVHLRQPFSLTEIHMPNGTFAGRQVLIVDMEASESKGFLDLPGELRNQIYGYLFVKKGCDIDIQIPQANPRRQLQAHTKYSLSPRLGFKGLYKGDDMSIHGILLLATCKEVLVEAASYLYGYNCFAFQTTNVANLFLDAIGKHNRERIMEMDTGWILKRDLGNATKLIADCKNLYKLHLNLRMIRIPPYHSVKEPSEVVNRFKAVLREMYRRDETKFFDRVTWSLSDSAVSKKKINKQMRDKILDVVGANQAMMKKIAEKRAAALFMQDMATHQSMVTMRITRGAAKKNAV